MKSEENGIKKLREMFTVEEFIAKYNNLSDEALSDIYQNLTDYSPEAQEAAVHIVEKRGGLQKFQLLYEQKEARLMEEKRIIKEVKKMHRTGMSLDSMFRVITSLTLPLERVTEIIQTTNAQCVAEIEDRSIKPGTINRTLIGGAIGCLFSSVFMGIFMLQTNALLYLLVLISALFNYAIIRKATKQSRKNQVVLIASILFTFLSVVFASLIYDQFSSAG